MLGPIHKVKMYEQPVGESFYFQWFTNRYNKGNKFLYVLDWLFLITYLQITILS